MSSFTSPLIAESLHDGRNWKIHQSFSYHVGSRFSRNVIRIPKGFVTDFASTDLLQWVALVSLIAAILLEWLLPDWLIVLILVIALSSILLTPYGKHGKAAVIHDYLYQTHKVSKAMADLIFYEAMRVAKTPKWRAFLMYQGVHLFGWLSYWRTKRRKEKK